MIPTALLLLTVTAVFVYFGATQWMWMGSLLCLAVVWFVGPRLPRSANPNARIGILGSRFSPA
jgi:energy-coupling factor transporter transmembrane protein EcfT